MFVERRDLPGYASKEATCEGRVLKINDELLHVRFGGARVFLLEVLVSAKPGELYIEIELKPDASGKLGIVHDSGLSENDEYAVMKLTPGMAAAADGRLQTGDSARRRWHLLLPLEGCA